MTIKYFIWRGVAYSEVVSTPACRTVVGPRLITGLASFRDTSLSNSEVKTERSAHGLDIVQGFFFSRPNWDPHPLTRRRVCPPFGSGGGEDGTRRGGGVTRRQALWYARYIQYWMYFVGPPYRIVVTIFSLPCRCKKPKKSCLELKNNWKSRTTTLSVSHTTKNKITSNIKQTKNLLENTVKTSSAAKPKPSCCTVPVNSIMAPGNFLIFFHM